MADMMKAWRIHAFGDSGVLKCDDVERPKPGAGELLVRLAATSVNPVDYKTREGEFPPVTQSDLPKVLGRDVAGTVEGASGGFADGDRVYGMPGHDRGTYAQYAVMKPGEIAKVPDGIDMQTAAAVPLAALTAWQGIFDQGKLTAGERVLILGAAGGVGHFAVQFAKDAGATVFATGRSHDVEFLKSLGVERAIDAENDPLSVIGGPVDLIYDLIGPEAQKDAWAVVKEDGRFVSTLEEPDADAAGKSGVRTAHYMAEPSGEQLGRIAAMIGSGAVRVVIADRFAFDQMPAAQDALEQGHVHGKIVVSID